MDEKEELRSNFLKLLNSLRTEHLSIKGKAIERRVEDFVLQGGWRRLGVYAPKDWEVPLWDLWRKFLEEGVKLFFPRVKGEVLEYVEVRDMENELVVGKFGIKEPSRGNPVKISEIDLFIIPGIAFDRRGVRIGRGRGYIDRTFKDALSIKVGVAYSFQVIDFIPSHKHDVKMDFVIHERETIQTKGG